MSTFILVIWYPDLRYCSASPRYSGAFEAMNEIEKSEIA
jgi:hypothetical protein